MRSGADLWSGTPLVSFNHVVDPHFAALSSSLYTTIPVVKVRGEPGGSAPLLRFEPYAIV